MRERQEPKLRGDGPRVLTRTFVEQLRMTVKEKFPLRHLGFRRTRRRIRGAAGLSSVARSPPPTGTMKHSRPLILLVLALGFYWIIERVVGGRELH